MIIIEGKQYPNTKEFAGLTGISERKLETIAQKNPELTIKFVNDRLWDTQKFALEFRSGGFGLDKKDKGIGQLEVAK